ncbi:hypothetical protein NQ317_001939 [Molorchus minor]|uniref:C-type lectin domain-containing protein n=1 Tax=Molorchus minor TaxID=1323400 RepID=A0ABQ9JCS3_9CUCU|nr:hypothetical protein NQ317_001939 [Molorchus minor]
MGMHVIFLIVASLFAGTLALENSNAFAVWLNKTRNNTDQATDSSLNDTDQAVDPSFTLVHYGRKTYYIESILQANYFQAFQYCRYHGMQLLTILSQAEADFLERQVSTAFGHLAQKLSDGTNWSWLSTGNQINYTNWYPGEPTMVNEDCIEVKIYDNGYLQWNDFICSNRNNFICETFSTINCFDLMAELNKTSTTLQLTTSIL